MVYTKNYYHILGLETPALKSSSPRVAQDEVRKAYRNALLSAHPDKAKSETQDARTKPGAGNIRRDKTTYTVDDVKEAFSVLGDAKQRADYDRWLSAQPTDSSSLLNRSTAPNTDFILGLELLDLSDFETGAVGAAVSDASTPMSSSSERGDNGNCEDEDEGDETMEWVRACRCGADKGFRIREAELEDAETRGEKEVLVGCEGCSLWVRVGFDVEEG